MDKPRRDFAVGGGHGLERLPPSDEPAELGVLGCCLLEPGLIGQCIERFAVEGGRTREVFYDLRHGQVFEAMCKLHLAGTPVDGISLGAELRTRGWLEQIGGMTFLAALPEATPSAANLETYLGIVWEKFLARQLIQVGTRLVAETYDRNGISEGGIARAEREFADWQGLASRSGQPVQPQDLKRPGEFGEAVFARWFNDEKDEVPGLELPISFPLKIRPSELTLMCGEDGSGKSIFMGQISVVLMKQGWKGCLASFEVPSEMTLWMLQRQILGTGPRLESTEENRRRVGNSLAFLNSRMWIYDFLGITDWRLLLDVMRYAREQHGVDFFVIDSIMRIGIASDDLATQDRASSEFAAFTVQTGAHVFLVHHMNKTREASLKAKATGSKRWTDNANNVVEMQRNAKKKEKIADLENLLEGGRLTREAFNKEVAALAPVEDGRFLLGKQRFFGTPQNGSKYLWFDPRSLQFRDKLNGGVMDYLM